MTAADAQVTSAEVRDEIVDLLSRDLIGPWDGENETVKGTPRARYLAGALAPVSLGYDPIGELAAKRDAESENDDEPAVIPETEVRAVGGVPEVEDEQVSDADAREETEDRGPDSKIIAPSSMGLRFQVPAETTSIDFTARWGQYQSRREPNAKGRIDTFYDREQFSIKRSVDLSWVDLSEGHLEPLVADEVAVSVEVFPEGDWLIVEAALQNRVTTGLELPPRLWLFQAELSATSPDGEAVFLPTRDPRTNDRAEPDDELARLRLLYRDRLEFAIGRTASVTWCTKVHDHNTEACSKASTHERRATRVSTTWLPISEVPQTAAAGAPKAVLDMEALQKATADELDVFLRPLVDGYASWLTTQEATGASLPAHLAEAAEDSLGDAKAAQNRLVGGLALLTDPLQSGHEEALKAFAFMNRTMRDQRIRSQVAADRIEDPKLKVNTTVESVAQRPFAATWRPFQLAFILMQIDSLVHPERPRRSGDMPRAELLFFPTGGGKTEAYLGLAAFAFGARRLQGVVETPGGVLNGNDGVAVLMRYTLRLLTSQQFLRATTLMCAAELVRREDPGTWGEEPFRIGLWVGTAVSPKRFNEARDQIKEALAGDGNKAYGLTVLQFSHCPWCGTTINPRGDVKANEVTKRIHVYCGDTRGECPFSEGGSAEEGLPVLTVDDEIYRHPPTFLLATVDKFARLARESEAASLLGYVSRRCPRHGYKNPDTAAAVCGADHHNNRPEGPNIYPPADVREVPRLRPPDLVIQDELHLITGALGTAVGLFETAIDVLSSWTAAEGDAVKPLVIASTATVRNAGDQVKRLYGRRVEIFPPQVLSVSDTYFSEEVPISAENPGRRYVGVCAHGARLTLAEIRVSEILLLAGQKMLDAHGSAADPYATLVDYFSATRELAGMRRFLDDDVVNRISNADPERGYPRRGSYGLDIGELTSRISAGDISDTLTRLAVPFDPEQDTSEAKRARAQLAREAEKAGKRLPTRKDSERPYDVVLATSMLQVGVDVPRLGLMLVIGQPKNTAEYIQASSRVGRIASKPGLVITLANRSRPRDMAHYEQFEHFHETFYAHVEALSVTPFSDAALERGLTGMLIAAARVGDVGRDKSVSPEFSAGNVVSRRIELDQLMGELVERVRRAGGDDAADAAEGKLILRLDNWTEKSGQAHGGLSYEKSKAKDHYVTPLLVSPEETVVTAKNRIFQVANSMREVQPEIILVVRPFADALAEQPPPNAPKWTFNDDRREKGS